MTIFEFILIFITLVFIILVYLRHKQPKSKKIAIQSVFIAKENILFLQEWIDYHIFLGVDYFYLYDNSKVNVKSGFDNPNPKLIPGKTNKYGINYDNIILTSQEINYILEELKQTYKGKVFFIDWSPQDENGNVLYNQIEAITDCLENLKKNKKVEWLAVIDTDEYLVCPDFNIAKHLQTIPKDVSNIVLKEIKYESRFFHLDKKIIDIHDLAPKCTNWDTHKNICRVQKTDTVKVHYWSGIGKEIQPDDIFFCHYNSLEKSGEQKRVIPEHISNKIKFNKYSHPDWKQSKFFRPPKELEQIKKAESLNPVFSAPSVSQYPQAYQSLSTAPLFLHYSQHPQQPQPPSLQLQQAPTFEPTQVYSQQPQQPQQSQQPQQLQQPKQPSQLPFQQVPIFEPNPNLKIITNQVYSQQPQQLQQQLPFQEAPIFEPNPNVEIITNQVYSQQPHQPQQQLPFQQAPTYEANPNLHVIRQPIQKTKDLNYCEKPY